MDAALFPIANLVTPAVANSLRQMGVSLGRRTRVIAADMLFDVTDPADPFAAVHAAEAWCREHGFSVGRMQAGAPRGLIHGECVISKWRNLTSGDRRALHGIMLGGRGGPVQVVLYEGCPLPAEAAE